MKYLEAAGVWGLVFVILAIPFLAWGCVAYVVAHFIAKWW